MLYIFLANGFETVEAMAPIDLCRRAGLDIKTVSITNDKTVISSHNIPVVADITLNEVNFDDAAMLILPGGMPGTTNLEKCDTLINELKKHYNAGKKIAAICAAPKILGALNMLAGKKACIFPGMEDNLIGAIVEYNKVSKDGNIITSRGMGCATDFGAAIVAEFCGQEKADELLKTVVYK